MLSLNDSHAWYYPSHGHDEEHTIRPERGNWGKKHVKSARWARTGKIAGWGPGMDEWEAEQRARERVKELLPGRRRSRSPPRLAHLRSPSPPMMSPYRAPNAPHLSYSSFVMDQAVTNSFRSRLLDELEEATNGLIEGEATLRRALGRLWQAMAEEGDEEGKGPGVVPKVEEEEEGDGGGASAESDERLEKAMGCLRELEDDGREYVERLEEIREGIGEVRTERVGVWGMVRIGSVSSMQREVKPRIEKGLARYS